MTAMTQNGISTTAAGKEQYETFYSSWSRNPAPLIQYDYRHTNGRLFSCVKRTLEDCRAARDEWMKIQQ